MNLKSVLQVVGQTDVRLIRVGNAFKQINVFHGSSISDPARLRPMGYGGQSSPFRDFWVCSTSLGEDWLASRSREAAKTGGAKGSRTPDLLNAIYKWT